MNETIIKWMELLADVYILLSAGLVTESFLSNNASSQIAPVHNIHFFLEKMSEKEMKEKKLINLYG